jgi:Flp pilus assembly protein TadD
MKPSFYRLASAAACALTLGLGGCAGSGAELSGGLFGGEKSENAVANASVVPQTELERATSYWGDKFAKSPAKLENALNYARNLKAMKRKREALAVLQQASNHHGQNRELASEYGRLALELDQLSVARAMLNVADDPAKPDWRVVSARGTLMAKEGKYKDAIPLFQRAMVLSGSNPSVLNNLAMAYAMDGRAADGERLLREAAARDKSPMVQKNLALVLGLQGKYDESKVVAGGVLPSDTVQSDSEVVRQMVRLDPQPYRPGSTLPATAPATTMVAKQETLRPATTAPALRASTTPAPANAAWDAKVAVAKQ